MIYFVLTGLIIVYPAFMNMYPLVYSDTGTYILSSRELVAPVDRPLMYGLLIRLFSWQVSLWPVVIFQGALGSGLQNPPSISDCPRRGARICSADGAHATQGGFDANCATRTQTWSRNHLSQPTLRKSRKGYLNWD